MSDTKNSNRSDRLYVNGSLSEPLSRAMAVLESDLHRLMAKAPWAGNGPTWNRCLWASLCAQDYLRKVGFEAEAVPVMLYIVALREDGTDVHSLALGAPQPGVINLHMAVKITDGADSWLLDPTLRQARRPAWENLPAMMVNPINPEKVLAGVRLFHGRSAISQFLTTGLGGGEVAGGVMVWYHDPDNRHWSSAPDAKPERRTVLVRKMLGLYAKRAEFSNH
jgi:hypothetical protein